MHSTVMPRDRSGREADRWLRLREKTARVDYSG
jgi:hypothetical protein